MPITEQLLDELLKEFDFIAVKFSFDIQSSFYVLGEKIFYVGMDGNPHQW